MAREAPALAACKPLLAPLGAGFLGIVGDSNHGYGYHLSRAALKTRGLTRDYSIVGPGDTGGPSDTACALDVRVTKTPRDLLGNPVKGWPAAPKFLERMRAERAAGRLPEVAELIGSLNGRTAMYAADSTGWKWVPYQGQGHVDWFHVAIYRDKADVTSFAERTFKRWGPNGLLDEGKPIVLSRLFQSFKNLSRIVTRLVGSQQNLNRVVQAQGAQIASLRADVETLKGEKAA